ncbi:hypothetical protein AMTRI_Chr13g124910 [Amborella trichopoda]
METPRGFFSTLWNLLAFLPIFVLLLILGLVKAIIVGPVVFLVIWLGNSAVIVGLWPYHFAWTYYCITCCHTNETIEKKYGISLKGLLFLTLPIPLLLYPVIGVLGSFLVGLGYGFFSPLMATFQAIGEGQENKFVRCFLDGTWSSVLGGCTIVRDFADVGYHSYYSIMDGILKSKVEESIEIKGSQIPGCLLVGLLGVVIDMPVITCLTLYKASLYVIQRAGPCLETVCVPFAGLKILLWPSVVGLATLAGIISAFPLGIYAAVVSYQENSIKKGFLHIICAISLFDEYTNDLLYMRQGSCFPSVCSSEISCDAIELHSEFSIDILLTDLSRPGLSPVVPPTRHLLPSKGDSSHKPKHSPKRTPSLKMQQLKSVQACADYGKELIGVGAIDKSDLEAWQYSNSKIVNIGLPAYMFLQCFLHSIKSGSSGFVMRDGLEMTSVNKPEERTFDWFFSPISIMMEQLKEANLQESEEAYLCKMEAWQNGGFPPDDEIRRAQLIGMSRKLQGFGLTLSRLPTFRCRFQDEVVKVLLYEAQKMEHNDNDGVEAAV